MKRISLSKSKRFEVFNRDSFTCQYCGRIPPLVMLHVDHVIPVAKGGTNDMENLTTSCAGCNSGKGSKSIAASSNPLDEARRAQEAMETTMTAKTFLQAAKARKKMRQELTEIICSLLHKPSCQEGTVTRMENAVYRVGSDQVIRWLTYSAMRVGQVSYLSEDKLCRYFSGCIRNHIAENGSEL